jgi:beta-mannosidase
MSEMDTQALKHDLDLMKAAHINTIRVHAHIEPERFYTLCDEMGFLVWQDYNLQWGYIDSPSFTKEAVKQAKEMVDMLYVHPSIFIWSMHNEPPWNSDWMKWKYPDYSPTQNEVFDEILYRTILKYDSYHITKKLSSNLEHPWFGWYSGKYTDFANPSKVPVISEFGAQAIPRLSSLKRFIPKKYLAPKSKKAKKLWAYHNFQFNWSAKNGVKFKKDIQTFIDDSQAYQANLIKFATEMLRIQKYTTTTGIFQFMFNEGWPSMNWGIVDYYRQTKPGYEALQKAYAPIIVVAKQLEDNQIELYVVNDTLASIEHAELHVAVEDENGVSTRTYPVSINGSESKSYRCCCEPGTTRCPVQTIC